MVWRLAPFIISCLVAAIWVAFISLFVSADRSFFLKLGAALSIIGIIYLALMRASAARDRFFLEEEVDDHERSS